MLTPGSTLYNKDKYCIKKDWFMSDPTDIEKKNLEAHVELCAERYRYLEEKLETVENKISGLNAVVSEIRAMMHEMMNKQNDRLINWGVGIIGTLVAVVAYFLITYVVK